MEWARYPPAHLLGIPAELRNLIYHHVFQHGGPSSQLDMLLTSKQFWAEAVGIAFSATEFLVDRAFDHETLPEKLDVRNLPDRLKPFVRSVAIKLDVFGERMPLLFDHGIFPTKIAIHTMGRTQHSDGLHTLRRLPGFSIPSAALIQANPNLQELEFRLPSRAHVENLLYPTTPTSYNESRQLSEQLQRLIDEDVSLSIVTTNGAASRSGQLRVSVKYVVEPPGWIEALWREYVLGSSSTGFEESDFLFRIKPTSVARPRTMPLVPAPGEDSLVTVIEATDGDTPTWSRTIRRV